MAETTENLQTLPLDSWHRAHGARMVTFAGYAMPVQYEGVLAEHNWTRVNAGLFDVSHMGQLTFHGERVDAASENVLEPASGVAKLPADRVRRTFCQEGMRHRMGADVEHAA